MPSSASGSTRRYETYSYNIDDQSTAFTYDGNGNPIGYNGVGLSFDPENRLIQYGSACAAGYTGDGLRAWKQTASGRVYFLNDGTLPVCEMDGTGNIVAFNVFGANGLLSRQAGGIATFYTFDLSSNVAQRLDANGNILSSDVYDSFGNRQSTGGTDVFGFGAQWGYYADPETGLSLLTNRYYDPATGRFLTRDPMGYEGGINLYNYVRNMPTTRTDPSGLFPCLPSMVADCKALVATLGPGSTYAGCDSWIQLVGDTVTWGYTCYIGHPPVRPGGGRKRPPGWRPRPTPHPRPVAPVCTAEQMSCITEVTTDWLNSGGDIHNAISVAQLMWDIATKCHVNPLKLFGG